jgi:putative endonuclease
MFALDNVDEYMYYVYILKDRVNRRYYVGQTSNLEERLKRHNAGRSVYTRKGCGNWELSHTEEFINKKDALSRERKIKGRGIQRYLNDISLECK